MNAQIRKRPYIYIIFLVILVFLMISGRSSAKLLSSEEILTSNRKRVLIDAFKSELPICGELVSPSNLTRIAFPVNSYSRLYLEKNGVISYFELKGNRLHRIWQAGFDISKRSNWFKYYNNTFIDYIKYGSFSKVFECGHVPKNQSGDLYFVESWSPPGKAYVGILSKSGFDISSDVGFNGTSFSINDYIIKVGF